MFQVNDQRVLVEQELLKGKRREDGLKLENVDLEKRIDSLSNQLATAFILKGEQGSASRECFSC